MTPNRTNRLAPFLVVTGCVVAVLFGGYVGGYFVLGERSASGWPGRPLVKFESLRSFRIYKPALFVEAKLRRCPIEVKIRVSQTNYEFIDFEP